MGFVILLVSIIVLSDLIILILFCCLRNRFTKTMVAEEEDKTHAVSQDNVSVNAHRPSEEKDAEDMHV
jgi:hypothetical protein